MSSLSLFSEIFHSIEKVRERNKRGMGRFSPLDRSSSSSRLCNPETRKENWAREKKYNAIKARDKLKFLSIQILLVKVITATIFRQMPGITVRLLKPGPPKQWKPIRWQNWNNRFQHFWIQPIKCSVQNNEISTCSLWYLRELRCRLSIK